MSASFDSLAFTKELEKSGIPRNVAEAHACAVLNHIARHYVTRSDLDEILRGRDSPRLISITEACQITSLSRSSINLKVQEKAFPPVVRIGENRVAFVKSEVVAWVEGLIAARGWKGPMPEATLVKRGRPPKRTEA